jgi:signal recognition particle GTPase
MEDMQNSSTETAGSDASGEILEELRELGRNLKAIIQSVWESEERKKLERELETGLNEVYTSLSKTAKEFSESSTGKNIKAEIEDLGERIRSGEVEIKVRDEILTALRTANVGLKKAADSNTTESDFSNPTDKEM